jgi:hypothetical protein
MPILAFRHCIALSLCLAAPVLAQQARPAADDPYRAERAEFMRAYANVENGADANTEPGKALRDYPLYPYLQAARLRQAIIAAPTVDTNDDPTEAFLTQHGTAPVTRELRHAWLDSLAQREQWNRFLGHYIDTSADTSTRAPTTRNVAAASAPASISARPTVSNATSRNNGSRRKASWNASRLLNGCAPRIC